MCKADVRISSQEQEGSHAQKAEYSCVHEAQVHSRKDLNKIYTNRMQ